METTILLQEPFSYAAWPIVLLVLLLMLLTFVLITVFAISLIRKYMKHQKPVAKPVPVVKNRRPKPVIKQEFLQKMVELEAELQFGKITVRACYQKLSSYIREFAYQMTGIDLTKYTLEDIRGLKVPYLEELIAEYYAPEFARDCVGDALLSIGKTKKVIETWN